MSPSPSTVSPLVARAKAALALRLEDKFGLAELAADFGCSRYYLSRLFRREVGMSIPRYRLELRLRRAIDRLADAKGDFSRLALELGFSHHSHFTSAFRRVVGCSPSQARTLILLRRST